MKFILVLFLLVFSLCLFGQHYTYNAWRDGGLMGGSAIMLGGSLYLDQQKTPFSIDEILTSLPSVRGFDRVALPYFSRSAKNGSDVLFYLSSALPMSMLASEKLEGEEIGYLLMYCETIALNAGVTLLTKSATDRRRPYFYNSNAPIEERQSLDARKAFFSGHTSHSAALSFFTAKVFTDLYPDSRWKPAIWVGAASLPAVTGYLRVRSGKHFPTDVIVGYLVGAGIGILVPGIHRFKPKIDGAWKLRPGLNGIALSYSLK